MGWSPSADSIIHAALISLSALSVVSRKLPGHEALNTCSLSWSCQIDDATIRVTQSADAAADEFNNRVDCLTCVSPAGEPTSA